MPDNEAEMVRKIFHYITLKNFTLGLISPIRTIVKAMNPTSLGQYKLH